MIPAGERPGDTTMTRATRENARVSSASNVPRQYGAFRRFEEPALHLAGSRIRSRADYRQNSLGLTVMS